MLAMLSRRKDFHIEMMNVGKETKKVMTMSEESDANSETPK